MSMLIREFVSFNDVSMIKEEAEGKKWLKIVGPMLEAENLNRNNRKYKQATIEREVKRYNEEYVSKNTAIGELSHPLSSEINPDRVSHLIENLHMESNIALGKAKILDTVCGRTVQALMEGGVKLGVSSRGVGSMTGNVVNEDYRLICIDIVTQPSAPSAWVDGIMEGKQYIMQGDTVVEMAIDNMKKTLDNHGSKAATRAIKEFLQSIKNT